MAQLLKGIFSILMIITLVFLLGSLVVLGAIGHAHELAKLV